MSSSKVYKKSSGFQPENILKNNSNDNSGWNSTKFTDSESSHYSPAPIYNENSDLHIKNEPIDKAPSKQPKIQDSLEEIIDKNSATSPPLKPQTRPPQPATPSTPATSETKSKEEVKQLVDEAYKNGVLDGLKRAEEDYKTGTAALLAISEQLNTTREIILQNSIGEMQDLVLTIAEKVIRHSITAQDDTIVATVEDAMRQTIKSDEFYVCINQQDYDIIHEKSSELIAQLSGLDNIVIKIDNSIEPGGCKVESDYCTVDATVASQLQIITDQVKSRR